MFPKDTAKKYIFSFFLNGGGGGGACMYHGAHVEVKGQTSVTSSVLPPLYGFWGLSSGC